MPETGQKAGFDGKMVEIGVKTPKSEKSATTVSPWHKNP